MLETKDLSELFVVLFEKMERSQCLPVTQRVNTNERQK
jgi:hypothetical protein